ncbi:hypothetical protein F5Y19DRAFT_87313 [Xylariaceae sp. FL1651]|nr:hypothetical protein F5Y19DRAFT_87313 [Xylariaceae sp. FL1651]
MAAPTHAPPPSSPDTNRLAAFFKRFTGKGQRPATPSTPGSEPGLSRDSSPASGFIRRVSRQVVPGLPRAKTFKRQQSENREKLEPVLPTPAERRAVSVDRRFHLQRSASHSSQPLPCASAPDILNDGEPSTGQGPHLSHTMSAPQGPVDEKQFLSLDNVSTPSIDKYPDDTDETVPTYQEALSIADAQSITTSQYDAMIHDELERKWILNLSMHFRDKSRREKFFVTYREKDSIWRRVTISLDYRNAPDDSLEKDLINTKFQREKSAKIYEAIRESLQDIQFYETVTNLKLQTADGRLHVHVVEDVNEIVHFPTVRMVQHMGCRRVRESELKFDSHMSGFVYKVQVDGQTLIKKEIPGPDTIDEFLYEVNALNSLRFSPSIIEFYGVVVDDDDQVVKGLLISYAEQGALIDVIYDSQEHGEQDLSWAVREKWARQIVQGLSDIHEAGFVQGDFTLSNIVIDDSGNAKIIDINRRGCPVGWEPPEATPLIDSNQRISMYIGVKSDLYQLGMVLWALATLEDEPEAHRRPLRLKPELDVPSWYRRIVENCLHENPRLRLQATALLTMFPKIPYGNVLEHRGVPSISVHDGTSFQKYVVDESHGPPEVITVEPRNSWADSSISNTQATSPSFSDEPYYPPRGRSPPSPSPKHHDLYNSPYINRNEMWMKTHGVAAVDSNPTADEARVETSRDLENTTVLMPMSMEEELDLIEASLRAGKGLEYDSVQAPGGNSQVEDALLRTTDVEPHVVAVGQDEKGVLLSEDESKVSSPTNDPTPGGSSDGTPIAEAVRPDEGIASVSERPLENATPVEPENQDDNTDDVIAPDRGQNEAVIASACETQAKTTEPVNIQIQNQNLGAISTYDRTENETEDMSTRLAETVMPTTSDLISQKNLPLTEPPGPTSVGPANQTTEEQSLPVCSDEHLSAPATETTQNTEIFA